MQTNSNANVNDGGSEGTPGHGLSQPAGERLQQLCQGIMHILERDAPQEPSGPANPNHCLQVEAGRILRPHLEAGLRELTEVLREDLLVRLAYVQQLERLTELDHDSSSLSRLLQGQSRPLAAPFVSESPPLAASPPNLAHEMDAPLPSLRPPEYPFDWESAPLQGEQPISSEPASPAPKSATTVDVATPKSTASLLSSQSASLEADLRHAAELWRQGDEDRALALCSQIIQQNPAAAPAYLLRGQMYEQRRQPEYALTDFTSAIALCPHHAKAYLRRGLIHLRQKAWPEAIADANEVIRLQPSCGSAYFIRASASFQQGDPRGVLADLNRVLQQEPNNVLAYNERGLLLASRGDYPQALADYTRALRLKPRFVPARYNRALALLQQGELDLALAAFTELIQLTPDNAMAYYQRARIHQARQEFDRAIADCTHTLKLHPRLKEAETCLQELQQLTAAQRREPSSPSAIASAADAAEEKADVPPKKKPSGEGNPADGPTVSKKEVVPSSREPANTQRNCITLSCKVCGTVSQVTVDRLHRKFQCRKCRRLYAVRPDGRLTEIFLPRSAQEQFKALIWKGARLSPRVGLLLLVLLGAWYGWRSFLSARSLPALPNKLEPRAEMLVKAWLNHDAERMQMLTTPEQEGRIHAWLRKHSFPLTTEELKSSRTWIHQTKIEIRVLKEERDRVRLGIKVITPVSPPVNLEQEWAEAAWYFQPFPNRTRPDWQSASRR